MAKNVSLHEVNSIVIKSDNEVTRTPPRPKQEQEDDYSEKYDYHTVFYDLFRKDGHFIGIGPPLQNLRDYIAIHHEHTALDRVANVKFESVPTKTANIINLPVIVKDDADLTKSVEIGIFDNLNVVVTMSKDNDLQWIKDWAEFYGRRHNVKGVLIYDNNSTKYSTSDICEALESVESIDVAVVVNWPFKYGPETKRTTAPKGKPLRKRPDSNYCQLGMFEHARMKYLSKSAMVINCDIDELIVSDLDLDLQDLINDEAGALIDGRWIQATSESKQDGNFRHKDFWLYNKASKTCPTKWVVKPSLVPQEAQWMTHRIDKLDLQKHPELCFRHFRGISTNWKEKRTEARTDQDLVEDAVLKENLDLVFTDKEK
ncbi:hypothetical protein [Alteromonas macleodii]|uniref:hypothetical protein n=1 Tax=Alteromonas macleodii TaxID=28108 RepID=UPI00057CF35C|nr:hypothetical protein [Alteromonas macleodii]KHT54522.1 hypothetical protein RJ43_08885 [Alteromonas macleodii]